MTYEIFREIATCEVASSGEALGRKFQMSRAGIAKHIKKLQECGIKIIAGKGGYEYKKTDCLCEYTLKLAIEKLNSTQKRNIECIVKTCGSTLNLAKEMVCEIKNDFLIVAPMQTFGRGRLGRSFLSAEGGVYMSLCHRPENVTVEESVRFVLMAGLAVHNALLELGVESKLKWPNDVFVLDKKICGIVLESGLSCEFVDYVVFGIGINANNQLADELKDIATSLKLELSSELNRVDIASRVVGKLYELLDEYRILGFDNIKKKYISVSKTIGRHATVKAANGLIEGFAEGITEEGFLLLKTNNGSQKIVTGDVLQ